MQSNFSGLFQISLEVFGRAADGLDFSKKYHLKSSDKYMKSNNILSYSCFHCLLEAPVRRALIYLDKRKGVCY